MLIRMCHEKKKKRKISVTINNKRQTLRDDHPTGFFYHNHHHHPKKPSYHLRISEAFNYSTGGRNTGLGITWCGGGGSGGRHSAHAHWQQTWRLQTISTYFHPGSHGARRAERVRAQFPRTHSLTHTHTTVRLSNVSSHVHGKKRCCCCRLCHRPFPPCIPLAFCFQANLNFVFTAKKNYAHQTHRLCAKNPHRFFSNTPSRLCPVEMVLRSTMQYVLYKTDFYIIVLD